ncbi:hypothetical protein K1719_020391 [Acacia pycnantha]|nr:hypothetical protein K1719_020391 [Acacia pycnantha]
MALSLTTNHVHVPLSTEENDLIHRSSKKIKNGENSKYEESWPKLGTVAMKQWGPGFTFAEKLQGLGQDDNMTNITVEDDDKSEDNISDSEDCEPLCVISEDPNRNIPTFTFSEKMKKRLYKAWSKAVIVKLLGRNIGYKLLLSILQKLWAKKGVIKLINIGNGFYVVKFTNKMDYMNALTGGPWMLFDHYLTLEDCKMKQKVSGTGVKSDGGVGMEAGNTRESVAARMNTDQMKGDGGDIWRVVQRPRRSKKGSKDKQQGELRRVQSGSRFGVLTEEGNGDDVALTKTTPNFVQSRAIEWSVQRADPEVISWDRKGETQKMVQKDDNQMGEKGEKEELKQGRQVARKEKRTRDSAKAEMKRSEDLRLTFGGNGTHGDKKGEDDEIDRLQGIQRMEDSRSGANLHSGVELVPVVDPVWITDGAAVSTSDGPNGKFWNGPSDADLDSNMLIEGDVGPGPDKSEPGLCMDIEGNDGLGFVSAVPETQEAAGI